MIFPQIIQLYPPQEKNHKTVEKKWTEKELFEAFKNNIYRQGDEAIFNNKTGKFKKCIEEYRNNLHNMFCANCEDFDRCLYGKNWGCQECYHWKCITFLGEMLRRF